MAPPNLALPRGWHNGRYVLLLQAFLGEFVQGASCVKERQTQTAPPAAFFFFFPFAHLLLLSQAASSSGGTPWP
jgi:hypothetical protein